MSKTIYKVGCGGTTKNEWSEFEDLQDALDHCLSEAWDQAAAEGIDPHTVDLWEAADEWKVGACPEGDDGAYWPMIEIEVIK